MTIFLHIMSIVKQEVKPKCSARQTSLTDQLTANYAFVLTQIVFRQYQKYLGVNFSGENLQHFQNAVSYQKQAILALKQSQEPEGYLDFMNLAYTEYEEISI